ncbi:MAG TPA: ABC transporter permease [Mycobacteriales bacterium]|nr:ABC transporter permease [Mycobacteriales bacterium]
MSVETRHSAGRAPAQPATADAGSRWTRRLAETPEIGVVLACVAVFLAVYLNRHSFANTGNLQEMGRNLAEFGTLAIGESLVIITGGIDLSVGSLAALSGVFAAWLFVNAGLPLFACVLIALAMCAAVGFGHGWFVTRLNVPPFVITLVTFTAARGVAQAITRSVPVTISGQGYIDLNRRNVLAVPLPTIIFVVVMVVAWFFLERTYLGRQTYAVGGNREAARLAGINTGRRVVWAYVASAVLAGIVGILISARLGLGDPSVASGYELDAIAAAVIGGVSLFGGQGRIVGIVAGGVLLVLINNGLIVLNVSPYYQQIVLGAVLGAAITVDRLRARRLGRARRLVVRQPPVAAPPPQTSG